MAASINGNNISLTRGDTLILQINITQDGRNYIPGEGDKVRFAMKKSIGDADALILKDIPTDNLILQLDPEDTKNLAFGAYKYDIELTTSDGAVDTFIGPATFTLTEEVY
jgi:hypothetical protein